MKSNQQRIAALLERFDQGISTIEEEQELTQFFFENQEVPAEWEPYREMFAYFEAGMPASKERQTTPIAPRILWMKATVISAVAAAILVAFLLWPRHTTKHPVIQTSPQLIAKADTIEPAEIVLEAKKPRKVRKVAHKHSLSEPLISQELIAMSEDSVITTDMLEDSPLLAQEIIPEDSQTAPQVVAMEDSLYFTPKERELMRQVEEKRYLYDLYASELAASDWALYLKESMQQEAAQGEHMIHFIVRI